jgi:hypothetical protein
MARGATEQSMADENKVVTDRRSGDQRLHEIFAEAYVIALPYIDPARGLYNQPLLHHAYIILAETYPFLTQQELALLVPALECVFYGRARRDKQDKKPGTIA